MSYPTTIPSFVTKINKNASGWYVPTDAVVIPSSSPFETYLDHVPRDVATTAIAGYTYTAGAPGIGQYNLDLIYGKVTFNAANAGAITNATYYSLGDDIMAEHMNELQANIVLIDTELGTDPAGASGTVRERIEGVEAAATASGINGQRIIDDTVRAGALRSDIKGLSWNITKDVLTDISAHKNVASSAHIAAAIDMTAAGSTTADTVQAHMLLTGNSTQTDENPHGTSVRNLGPGILPGNFGATIISGKMILASGNVLPVTDGMLSASGTYDVGTAVMPWASGNFDSVQAKQYKTGASIGVDGGFTTNDGKTVLVKNGLIVAIL
jgi:hypothetical protein